jgi:hypothetical protein
MTNAINETVVTTNETVAPVAVVSTDVDVSTHMENLKAKKEAVVSEKIPHAAKSFNHKKVIESMKGQSGVSGKFGIPQPAYHGALTGKFDELSDGVVKKMGATTGHEMFVTMVPSHLKAEFEALSDKCNESFYTGVVDKIAEANAEKNSKKIEAEAKAAQKAIDKEAKMAQKLIDDAEKKAKKEAAKLAKDIAEIDEAVAVINSDALDISGLFVGEEIVTPVAIVTPTVEADPILAAAIAHK